MSQEEQQENKQKIRIGALPQITSAFSTISHPLDQRPVVLSSPSTSAFFPLVRLLDQVFVGTGEADVI